MNDPGTATGNSLTDRNRLAMSNTCRYLHRCAPGRVTGFPKEEAPRRRGLFTVKSTPVGERSWTTVRRPVLGQQRGAARGRTRGNRQRAGHGMVAALPGDIV